MNSQERILRLLSIMIDNFPQGKTNKELSLQTGFSPAIISRDLNYLQKEQWVERNENLYLFNTDQGGKITKKTVMATWK